MSRVLHVLSQRPSLTGSGVTLVELARHAEAVGWQQMAAIGVPAEDSEPMVGVLGPDRIRPLVFGEGALDFPVPGMSDVMPYESSRFSELTPDQLGRYKNAWLEHLGGVLADFRPDLIHSHHFWLLSSWLKEVAPSVPVVTHSHGTGLRQLELCPHLAGEVRKGCARNDRFLALHRQNRQALAQALDLAGSATAPSTSEEERIRIVGAGYADQIFQLGASGELRSERLLYVGKYSAAKGLPSLLDAVQVMTRDHPDLELHVAGSGAGQEAESLRARMEAMAPAVILHGQLSQEHLAELMKTSAVCVLPSYYEGLPLVLAEALACGCRLVSTALPGVEEQLTPSMDDALELVPLPRMTGVDTPLEEDLPAFTQGLIQAIEAALQKSAVPMSERERSRALAPFTWGAVFHRIEAVWADLL